jgi:hypothetical protein
VKKPKMRALEEEDNEEGDENEDQHSDANILLLLSASKKLIKKKNNKEKVIKNSAKTLKSPKNKKLKILTEDSDNAENIDHEYQVLCMRIYSPRPPPRLSNICNLGILLYFQVYYLLHIHVHYDYMNKNICVLL